MIYKDSIRLVTVGRDMYNDKTATFTELIPANLIRRSGITHGENIEGEISDATVYLKPIAEVLNKRDDLEGMYLHAEPFSQKSWYRISTVSWAERKLLNNAVDNVYCRLEKVAGINALLVS